MHVFITILFLAVYLFTSVYCKNVSAIASCKHTFEKGVDAYLNNQFHDCVMYMEEALQIYHEYNKKVKNCRLQCHENAELSEPLYHVDIENLRFFEKVIRNTFCIIKCRNTDKHLFEEYNLDEDSFQNFEKRKPYEYLHICYFQIKKFQKASSAAFTFLVENPNNEGIKNHLKYYSTLPGVIMEDIINYEAKDYVYLYVRGASAYKAKQWNEVIHYMEESLASYIQSEEECRAQCEGPYDQGWFPDFIPSIANHFTSCLRCKLKCKNRLSNLNGKQYDDLLESHYHYLQYAYFKVGNIKAACECVSSYLLFNPLDETMLYNMEYYEKMPKIQADFFTPRQEAMHYFNRYKYEEKLILFIQDTFSNEIEMMVPSTY